MYPDASGTNIYEKDLTLAISLKLQETLEAAGYNVVMTRTGETAGDLYERSELANAAGADLFVSVHINASGTVPPSRALYIPPPLPAAAARPLPRWCRAPCARPPAPSTGASPRRTFVVLRETNKAAVLVECGFMSNVEELEQLKSDDYQWKLAQGITQGVTDYLNAGVIQK